jgi:integrase
VYFAGMRSTSAPQAWTLLWTSETDDVPANFHPGLEEWARNLRARERMAHILPRTPIFVDGDGNFDFRLMEFCNSLTFTSYAAASREAYAYEIKWWCEFLGQNLVTWDTATEDDFGAFKRWRTEPQLNARYVQGATWNKAVSALELLYAWASNPRRLYVDSSPIPRSTATREVGAARSGHARSQRSRWVSLRTYRVWRDVGFRGFALGVSSTGALEAASEDLAFRGRNVQRNAAFADMLFSTALRRREAASLLTLELPAPRQESSLAAATAKGNRSRPWSAEANVLDSVNAYVNLARRAAVIRARKAGRYDSTDVIWVDSVEDRAREGRVLVTNKGDLLALDSLTPESRMRLMRLTNQGPEPLWLWLSEDGIPKEPHGWSNDFAAASARFGRECVRLERPQDTLVLSPHSLRFSFALFVLLALHQHLDRLNGWSAQDPYDERRYSPAYDIVRDLLGHRSTETTRAIYLEPLRGMRGRALIGAEDVHEALAMLSAIDPRVRELTIVNQPPASGKTT